MKSRTSQSIVASVLGIAILVVGFNAWLAYRSVEALAESHRWVSHTWRVIDSLEQVNESIQDAETAARGYLMTGDFEYLGPYYEARRNLPAQLDEVAGLTLESPAEAEHLSELRAVIESRLKLLQNSIDDRRSGQNHEVQQDVLSDAGMAEMNRGRALVVAMREAEDRLLVERLATSHRDLQRALATVIFASVADLLLILIIFRHTTIERRLREQAHDTANHLQKLQSINDAALSQLTAGELTSELLSRVQKVISADMVLLCTRRGEQMRVDAAVGMDTAWGSTFIPSKGGPMEQALAQDRTVCVADTAAATISYEPVRRYARSLLLAPLSGSRSVTGVLVAGRKLQNAFDREDEELLSVVSGRIAIALDRAAAYDAERQARREAESRTAEVRQLNTQLEARVSQRTAELEATNRELESFSYSVSHDLRAPLRTIDGFSAALIEDYSGALDSTGQDYLRRIREGVQRMGHLIDSLLQLSRVTRAELVREPVSLSALGKAVADELAAQNSTRNIIFNVRPGLEGTGDTRLLRAALENLLGNAVKFTARQPEARIELGSSGDAYFVKDNGVGFDMRYAGKLFNAFNRLHGDRDFRGSGIGLATVARIIHRHEGKIWAEGEVGRGATFWFTLG